MVQSHRSKEGGSTYLGYSHLKVLLSDMDTPFPQSIHAGFCAHTLSREEKLRPCCWAPLALSWLYYFPEALHCPASLKLPVTFTSAPEAPGISSAIFLRLIPLVKFIFREWIFKMSSRA